MGHTNRGGDTSPLPECGEGSGGIVQPTRSAQGPRYGDQADGGIREVDAQPQVEVSGGCRPSHAGAAATDAHGGDASNRPTAAAANVAAGSTGAAATPPTGTAAATTTAATAAAKS